MDNETRRVMEQARAKISMLHRLCLTWVDKDSAFIPGVSEVIADLTRLIEQEPAQTDDLLRLVAEQAEDDGLWPEAYLQAAQRRLHAAVEWMGLYTIASKARIDELEREREEDT